MRTIQGTKVVHAVRNVQPEYDSKKKRNIQVGETYCGRHYPMKKFKGAVTCKVCLKAMSPTT